MSVFDTIHAMRPEVEAMPLTDRRMIRESLFGVGHDDSARSFGSRSESGAVVSTAPHGTRAGINERPRSTGSLLRIALGLLVALTIGAVAWVLLADDPDTAVPEVTTPSTTAVLAESTAAPTTAPPFIRTGVTSAFPILLPATPLAIDEATIGVPLAGSSSLLLSAPDGRLLWMAEFDGEPPNADGLDVRQIGSVGVGVARERDPAAPVSYQLLTSCGLVILNDAPGVELDRPDVVSLFESMSIDGDATIDASLPSGFSIVDIGDFQTAYTAVFRVQVFTETRAARLVQVPGGSLAQLAFGGRQLEPTTFLGGPAFIDAAPLDPALVSIFWQDESTVFNISSSELNFADLESFVDSLDPVATDEWNGRFDSVVPEPAPAPSCTPQPGFGPTLDP